MVCFGRISLPVAMQDHEKTKEQLIHEVMALRQQVSDLELIARDRQHVENALHQIKAELEFLVEERTAALKASNDQLVAEVAERQHAENALRAAKDQLQAVLDAVPGIVSWISSDLCYLGVNQHLADTFGLPPDAFSGQDIGFLQTSSDFNDFVREFFAMPDLDAFREVSARVKGELRNFLIVVQKYDQGRAAFAVGIDITERRRAEDALRKAEGKYRSIFENAVEGIFQTTVEGQYLSANPALARIYGYESPEELMASLTNIQRQLYFDPVRRSQFISLLQEHDAVTGFESQIYRKDGTLTWISENARAIRDDNGKLLYYEGAVEEISERKRAEEALQRANEELETRVEERTAALRELNHRLTVEIAERRKAEAALRISEEELRALFAAMTDVIAVFDAEGRYIKIVSTNSEMLYSPDVERIGKTIYDVLPAAQATLFFTHIQRVLNTGKTISLEYNLPITTIHAAGADAEESIQEAWYTASVSPMSDNCVIWVARDITERKRAESALLEAEEKYRSIFENAAEGIFQTTAAGRYISANPSLVRMYGYDSAAEMLADVSDIAHHYLNPMRRKEFIAALEQHGAIENFESEVYCKTGSVIWISENARAVRDEQGDLLYYEGTIQDITQRKQAEQALSESQRTLATLMSNLPGMAYRGHNDRDRTMQFISEGCFDLTGYQLEDLLHNTHLSYGQLIHPEDRTQVWQEIQLALSDRRSFQLVYRICTITGEHRWVWEQGQGIWPDTGELPILEGFITDITERKRAELALQLEQERSERLLLNILPQAIAQRLKHNHEPIADRFDDVSILFADIVDFTSFSAQIAPSALVDLLNQIFSTFDQLAERYGLEKIKTIGDAYMVVGGLPTPNTHHLEAIAAMALEMQQAIQQFQREENVSFSLRIGIHVGPVVAGVIGIRRFIYDLWGDAVNVASRMEAQGIGGRIQTTDPVYERLKHKFAFEKRGALTVKGKGRMTTYWLTDQK